MVYYRTKSTPEIDDELDKLKSEVESLNKRIAAFDYNCRCAFYPTSTRYFRGEHRPEQFIILIEGK